MIDCHFFLLSGSCHNMDQNSSIHCIELCTNPTTDGLKHIKKARNPKVTLDQAQLLIVEPSRCLPQESD